MAEAVIGIDLGTSNSVVAGVRDEIPVVLSDAERRRIHPSVVSFHPSGSILVGHEARVRRLVDPQNTVYGIKRVIGRPVSDPAVQAFLETVPYATRAGEDGGVLVTCRGMDLSAVEISGLVLHHMKVIAERALRQVVSKAVITVPANFNDAQRAATLAAGKDAGFEVLRMINEPTAAALAYGFGQAQNRRVLIYDFGGGTFDVTILEIQGDVFEVRATAGDTRLGGADLDAVVLEWLVSRFLEETRYDLTQNEVSMGRVNVLAEKIKIQLSSEPVVEGEEEEIAYGPDGKPLVLRYRMTRQTFEELVVEFVDRTFEICDEAFRLAGLAASDIDEVVLVGGTTRIPLVQRSVRSYLARTPLAHVHPDEVVALGAAIQAASLMGMPVRPPPPSEEAVQPGGTARTGSRQMPTTTAHSPDNAIGGRSSPPPTPLPDDSLPLPLAGASEEVDVLDLELDLDELAFRPPASPPPPPPPSLPRDTRSPALPQGPTSGERQAAPPAPPSPPPSVPLLLDVTPLSLGIETVGGYTQVIIPRNSPVPVEQSKIFSTSRDNQTTVTLRVCQGESRRFEKNTLLGHLSLSGLRPARRGETRLEVTFEIDPNGILKVRARDEASGLAQQAHIQLQATGGSRHPRRALAPTNTTGEYRPVTHRESPGGSKP